MASSAAATRRSATAAQTAVPQAAYASAARPAAPRRRRAALSGPGLAATRGPSATPLRVRARAASARQQPAYQLRLDPPSRPAALSDPCRDLMHAPLQPTTRTVAGGGAPRCCGTGW
jgi:hypothetical protein